MTDVNRRQMFAWAALLGLGAASAAKAEPKKLGLKDVKKEAEVNALYHCDFGQPERFSVMLRNINNHMSVYDFDPFKTKIVIVAHGPGIKFFLKDLAGTPWEKEKIDPEIVQRLQALAKYGVEAYLCQITFQRMKLDVGKSRDEDYIKLVPSGVATVAELQAKGFAYLKVA